MDFSYESLRIEPGVYVKGLSHESLYTKYMFRYPVVWFWTLIEKGVRGIKQLKTIQCELYDS